VDDDQGSLALSELEDMNVVDAAGAQIGELLDVVALCASESAVISGFFIECDGDRQLRVSWAQVAEVDIDAEQLRLSCSAAELEPASLRSDELALVDSVLDNQVLDMRRRVFVRVQDVILTAGDGELIVRGVDASSGALARRFGLRFLSRRLPRRSGDLVPWQDVNLISLRLSRLNFVEAFGELAELHPADIADVVSQVGPRERAAVLAALNPGLAADTLQEMEEGLRTAALQEMPLARAVAVLEQIETDEAADILSELPDDLAQELLARLPDEREEDLRELARHPEHTAGSLMSTEFITLPVTTSAGAALEWIRRERPEQHAMTYLYLLDAEGRLIGVASLRDLVLAEPDRAVAEIMEDDIVDIAADVDEEEVGRIMTKYDLLAIPVVDGERRPLGIVTLDDALDAVLPADWKQRLPRLFR
jgi:CBS domain-containing protein/sporulation protein YlmC with PRC-barrel domain